MERFKDTCRYEGTAGTLVLADGRLRFERGPDDVVGDVAVEDLANVRAVRRGRALAVDAGGRTLLFEPEVPNPGRRRRAHLGARNRKPSVLDLVFAIAELGTERSYRRLARDKVDRWRRTLLAGGASGPPA